MPESDINRFSENLRFLRKKSGMTQKELGAKLNYVYSAITNYERGCNGPSLEILVKLALIFNVSLEFLLGMNSNFYYLVSDNARFHYLYDEFSYCDQHGQDIIIKHIEALKRRKKIDKHGFLAEYERVAFGWNNLKYNKKEILSEKIEIKIAENIKILREKIGLKQNFLARALGISQTRLNNYESEVYNPSYRIIMMIAEFFGVSLEALLGVSALFEFRVISNNTRLKFSFLYDSFLELDLHDQDFIIMLLRTMRA